MEENTENTNQPKYPWLAKFAINLNDYASKGKLKPVIGRDEEIRRILQILSRKTKNNPIVIGESGVGKTSVVEALAQRIVDGDVPENLKDKVIASLDLATLVAGAKYKGEFEERIQTIVKEIIESNGQIILFIDEIHTLVGTGGGNGAMDAAGILKPILSRGEIRAIGATTIDEYKKSIEQDRALDRRFQTVMIDEPDKFQSISILRGIKDSFEKHHDVRIVDSAIISAVELSIRYVSDRFLPDKAIDLLDEACSKLRLEINSVPGEIDEISRRIQQLEIEREGLRMEGNNKKVSKITSEIDSLTESLKTFNLQWNKEIELVDNIKILKKDLAGYNNDIEKFRNEAYYEHVAKLQYGIIPKVELEIKELEDKLKEIQKGVQLVDEEVDGEDIAEIVAKWTGIPVSKMLKSEKIKLVNLEDELHKRIIGQNEAVTELSNAVRRSRSGLQDTKKPIGSFIFLGTTGVGKTETAKALAEYLFDDENAMVRIDMSEYMERHAVAKLIGPPPGYIGYEEGGQLTDQVRRKPYSVILFDEIEKAHPDTFNTLLQVLDDGRLTDNKGRTVDFKNTIIIMTSNIGSHIIRENFEKLTDENREEVIKKTNDEVMEVLKNTVRPEFLNRIDEIVTFQPLTREEIKKIVVLQFNSIKKRLPDVELELTEKALDYLTLKSYDPQFGARPVKRTLQDTILDDLSMSILKDEVKKDDAILIDYDGEKITFDNK